MGSISKKEEKVNAAEWICGILANRFVAFWRTDLWNFGEQICGTQRKIYNLYYVERLGFEMKGGKPLERGGDTRGRKIAVMIAIC